MLLGIGSANFDAVFYCDCSDKLPRQFHFANASAADGNYADALYNIEI